MTPQGIELTFATHVVGPFLLTHLLLGRLAAARRARIVHVSSGGMYASKLDVGRLKHDDGEYCGKDVRTPRVSCTGAFWFDRTPRTTHFVP